MVKGKRIFIFIILILIFAVWIFAEIIDFSRFWGVNQYYDAVPVDFIQRTSVFLSGLMVWIAGKDRLDKKDHRLLSLVFVIMYAAEAAFLTNNAIAALCLYSMGQILLTVRNGRGLGARLHIMNRRQWKYLILTGIGLIFVLVSAAILFYHLLGFGILFFIGLIYGLLICISTWTAVANRVLGLFLEVNARMVMAGMICFCLCDVMVGLDGVLNSNMVWLAANSLIWLFYTPAVVLLALSSYQYE